MHLRVGLKTFGSEHLFLLCWVEITFFFYRVGLKPRAFYRMGLKPHAHGIGRRYATLKQTFLRRRMRQENVSFFCGLYYFF